MATRYLQTKCPKCGETARGTLEQLEGCAELTFLPDGTCEHNGFTDVFYDSSATKQESGRDMLVCRCGETWASRKEETDDEPATPPAKPARKKAGSQKKASKGKKAKR